MRLCVYCLTAIRLVDGAWIDATDGDCCSGDDAGRNENEPHTIYLEAHT